LEKKKGGEKKNIDTGKNIWGDLEGNSHLIEARGITGLTMAAGRLMTNERVERGGAILDPGRLSPGYRRKR